MHQIIRFGAAIILLLSILFLARYQAAGAGSEPSSAISPQGAEEQSPLLAPGDPGTVKPPPFDVLIPVTGDYSIGGFCTLSVQLADPEVTLAGNIITPLPRDLPDGVHKVRQGCLLTYKKTDQFLNELTPEQGSTLICFAATPQKEMTVYFYDVYSSNPTWVALTSTTNPETGVVCAAANDSGVYVATFTT